MSDRARDWLPAGIVAGEGVRNAVSSAVAAWCEDWFARPAVRLAHLRTVEPEPAVLRAGWRRIGGQLAANLPRRNASRLLGWALDVQLEQQEQTETDQRLLEAFENRMLADLGRRIETALGMPLSGTPAFEAVDDPGGPYGGVSMALADAHEGDLMQLALPIEALLPFCRSSMPPRRERSEPMADLLPALGPTTVRIAASLGRAELSLDDLRNLAPGDVLVLGTGVNDPIDISLSGSQAVLAKARLTDQDGQLALILQA